MESLTLLEHKHIVLAVTGSIASYKAVDLASKLTQAGAIVEVIMTDSAQQFITPLTFEAVTGQPVYTNLWKAESNGGLPTHIAHVGLGEQTDLLVIVPATANTIAKLAHGLADDLLTVTTLATRCPILIAPAMDGAMYTHPATRANLQTLVERGVYVVEPEEGRFASGLVGKGRLPDTVVLMGHIRRLLGQRGNLAGQHVVVTAGGTRESLDPVRYISNRSSGKQGYSIAQAALDAGATVTLISSAQHLVAPIGVELVTVNTALEMERAVLEYSTYADVLVMAAAVADFRPSNIAEQKIKKTETQGDHLMVELVRNPDILLEVKAQRQETGFPRVVVGFAAESENLLGNAKSKLDRKGLDLLIANDISANDAGFEVDTNRVLLLSLDEGVKQLELRSKVHVAEAVVERIAVLLEQSN
ncbi:MAG: bifunctional phosphopantothenoylcysteine decarboxylase/phosphopantothenate--cysteine ligase CoaBC [Phototrophicaceae bacterium]